MSTDLLDHITGEVEPNCENPACDAKDDWVLGPVLEGVFTYKCRVCGYSYRSRLNSVGEHFDP